MDPRSSHPQHSPSEGFPISLPNGQRLALGIEEFSISSSSTASDLPGPSRVVGKMFSWLGAELERRIYLFADKLGYGPLALRRKFMFKPNGFHWLEMLSKELTKNQKKAVVRLVKYIDTGTTTTQLQAIELVCDLVSYNPAFRDEFHDAGLGTILNLLECSLKSQGLPSTYADTRLDVLLSSSRKALIYVEEVELTSAVKSFLNVHYSMRDQRSLSDGPAAFRTLISSFRVLYSRLDTEEKRLAHLGQLADHYCFTICLTFILIPIYFQWRYDRIPRSTRESPGTMLPVRFTLDEIKQLSILYHLALQRLYYSNQRQFYVYHWVFKAPREIPPGNRYYSILRVHPVDSGALSDLPVRLEDFSFYKQFHGRSYNVEAELMTSTKVEVSGLLNVLDLQIPLPSELDYSTLFYSGVKSEELEGMDSILYTMTIWEPQYPSPAFVSSVDTCTIQSF